MDAQRFDALTRAWSSGSRRGLLGTLLTLPWLGGLLAFLEPDEAAARKRRKNRRRRHKHGQGRPKNRRKKNKNKKRCKRKSRARICANRCGIIKNRKTCKKKINCGSCACAPPCSVCQRCDGAPGACVPDAALDGQPCGAPGEKCQHGVCIQTCIELLPDADLQQAIDDAPDGGCLLLPAATWTLSDPVLIPKNLTLIGAGAELTGLNGGNAVRVLQIEAGAEVTLQDLTVTNGQVDAGAFPDNAGGGILNEGTLVLRGVAVAGNTTTLGDGGGILNLDSATLIVEDGSRVAGNTTTFRGGGIWNDGGAVTLKAGSLVGGDTEAEANTAVFGGGIFNGPGGSLTLEDGSRVAGNTADFGGGILNDGGTLNLQDGSRVTGNTAEDGGGILNDGTLTLETGSRVAGNRATSDGGGILNVGTLTLQDGSRVMGNTATRDGGGIYNNGEVILKEGSLVGGDTEADANTAGSFGGGIYSGSGTVTLEGGSRVAGNTADGGGGIYNLEGTVEVQDGSRVVGNTATNDGGGIANFDTGTVTVETDAFVCDNQPANNQCSDNIDNCPNPIGGSCSG